MKTITEFMITGQEPDIESSFLAENVSHSMFQNIERFADNLFKHLGIDVEFTKHFKDRTNDRRNKPDITGQDLIDFFKKAFNKHGEHIKSKGDGLKAILTNVSDNINMPFTLEWDDKNQELDLVVKTVMRSKNFLSHGQKIMRFH